VSAYPALEPEAIEELAARLGAELAHGGEVEWAFGLGSCFEGLPHRDIDLAVRMSPGVRDDVSALCRLAERCEAVAGKPVDVRAIPPRVTDGPFAESAAAGRLVWARDPDAALAWAELAIRKSWDARALRRRAHRDMQEP
jgi:hypothetical protein